MFPGVRSIPLVCGVLVFLALAAPAAAMSSRPPEPGYAPDRVILKFREGITSSTAEGIIRSEGCTVKRFLKSTGVYIVHLPEGMEVPGAIDRFNSHPELLYAEPDYPAQTVTDP